MTNERERAILRMDQTGLLILGNSFLFHKKIQIMIKLTVHIHGVTEEEFDSSPFPALFARIQKKIEYRKAIDRHLKKITKQEAKKKKKEEFPKSTESMGYDDY